jgi:predicted regulator of Ras-like GTPase activity (Roadblock/LC7/MglB family)
VKHILEPLARIAGVRTAALITNDGVPITVQGRAAPRGGGEAGELDALAALAAGWIGEMNRATAPLSWDAPRHLVLRAVRGTLVAMQAPGALLVVVLDSGTSSEQLRLPMEAAVGRMLRHLRQVATKAPSSRENTETLSATEPNAPLPTSFSSQPSSRAVSHVPAGEAGQGFESTGNGDPTPSGD